MLEVAEHILKTKTANFDPAFLEDRYRTALASMLREKQARLPKAATPSPSPPPPQNVINLMDVLKRSLAAEQPSEAMPRVHLRLPSRRVASDLLRARGGAVSNISEHDSKYTAI
jgi:non-homologous end joining protein Ku